MAAIHATELARIRWQCRRGMLELDLLFDHFITSHYATLDEKTLTVFHELLNYADQDLFEYFFGNRQPPDKDVADVIDHIRRAVTA